MTPYRQLETLFRRIEALEEVVRVLDWDTAVMMPPGGSGARAEQMAALRLVIHRELCAPEIGELLADAEGEEGWEEANLREMRRRHAHATALPARLVDALSRARSECERVWRSARAENDFAAVCGALEKMAALKREAALCKAERLGVSPYEALLDQYEPGGAVALIDRLFDEIRGFLPDLVDAALCRQAARPASPPPGPFPIRAQRRAIEELMTRFGFDFSHGRLDATLHPFCGGVPEDVRVTTRYDEADFSPALMAALHETGHGLYKRALPVRWRLQPVGAARGMAIHESQSLLIEMQVCRSRAFCAFAAPILAAAFADAGPAWEPEALYRRQIAVRRGLIRVEADEVTYPLHVILRYRLERAMIANELRPKDLPVAWAEGMRSLLGVTPPTDREGCLQDIHWYDGYWGYFPTYTLGALIAAQLFAAARCAIPALDEQISAGEFAPLLAWLGEQVHAKGSLLSTAQLVESATGEPLGTAAFQSHLRNRYLS
jgi:carboxypeptidase Taq